MNCFFYDKKGSKYFSKVDALNDSQDVYLYYHDDYFINQNWKREPSDTLSTLYKIRAQQIRDEYDHVIIAYSGGIDSTNVLESFYYNNIHIDEILIVGAFKRDSKSGVDENHNGEIYHNCFETMKQLDLSKTKITLYDYTEDIKNCSLAKEDDWYKKVGSVFSFHNWFWYDIEKRFDQNKKTAIVFGIDKPIVFFDKKDRGYFNFLDICLFQYGMNVNKISKKLNNISRINFYWDPEASNILIKQSHMLLSVYKNLLSNGVLHKQIYDNNKYILNKIIYPVNNPLTFNSPKSATRLLSLRDNYALKFTDFKESLIYKNYIQGLEKIKTISTKDIYSRRYYLE